MRLLIITQKVDKNDPVLGFFCRWIEEFAKNVEQLTVICLQKGEFNLPANVRVLSLGKENGESRLKYLFNFYKYIWRERKNYDTVFVHMNQEYVLLGGLIWKSRRKKVWLWRNHARGNWLTRLAVLLSDRVFCTSPQSFTAKFSKTGIMPVGVDTDFFRPDSSVRKIPHSILFLGRIAPVKNVEMFIEALKQLNERGINFTATIAGGALPRDKDYERKIRNKVAKYKLTGKVKFTGPVTQEQARQLYREHEIYVNLTPSGSLDKTIFEAMACGAVPLVANQFFFQKLKKGLVLPEGFVIDDLFNYLQTTLRRIEEKPDKSHVFSPRLIAENSLHFLVRSLLQLQL